MSQSTIPMTTAEAGSARSTLTVIFRNYHLMGALSAIACLAMWQVISMNVSPIILPTPAKVADALVELTASGELLKATAETLWPFVCGLVVAFVIGTAIGLLLGIFQSVARIPDPYIFIFWSIPHIAWLPLFIAWFGVGNSTLVIFVFVSAAKLSADK